jgi:hypothetical protein
VIRDQKLGEINQGLVNDLEENDKVSRERVHAVPGMKVEHLSSPSGLLSFHAPRKCSNPSSGLVLPFLRTGEKLEIERDDARFPRRGVERQPRRRPGEPEREIHPNPRNPQTGYVKLVRVDHRDVR